MTHITCRDILNLCPVYHSRIQMLIKKWNISHLKVMQNENKEGESVKTSTGIYIISGANIKMEHQTENMYHNNLDIL